MASPAWSQELSSVRVLAVIPPRYFSLDISSGGGAVKVAATKEASAVRLCSAGGSIHGGSIAAMNVTLKSGGGRVAVSKILGSKARIDSSVKGGAPGGTAGGHVQVESLNGVDVSVATGGAPLSLGACISSGAHLSCGDVRIKELSTSDDRVCRIDVAGGSAATLNSITGGVEVRSEGGIVLDAQLSEGARTIDVQSPGHAASRVALWAPPTLPVELTLEGCGALSAPAGVLVEEDAPHVVKVHLARDQSGNDGRLRSRLERGQSAPACRGRIAGAHEVSLARRTWAEAMQASWKRERTD